MSFEHLNAPATKMVNTPCVCCQTPLVDAESLARQIGPHCWKKFMRADYKLLSEANRQAANKVIHAIAADRENPAVVTSGCETLRSLGLPDIAQKILERVAVVRIAEEGGRLLVKTPYDEQAVIFMRSIAGRRWNPEQKVNEFPLAAKPAIWQMLRNLYPGKVGVGPRGSFIVPDGSEQAATSKVA